MKRFRPVLIILGIAGFLFGLAMHFYIIWFAFGATGEELRRNNLLFLIMLLGLIYGLFAGLIIIDPVMNTPRGKVRFGGYLGMFGALFVGLWRTPWWMKVILIGYIAYAV